MRFVFFETPFFTRLRPEYLDDTEYGTLQGVLMQWPEKGELIPNTGGFRKLRWSDRRRRKGSRGGLRVIYYLLAADYQIWFFTIYDKDETSNLTAEQCRLLKNAIRDELRARRGRA